MAPYEILNKLFESWKEGDEKSFEKIFNQLFPTLLKFAYRALKDDALAEELVMDVFFKIWNKKNVLTIQGNIEQYLYKCVKYAIIDHYRKRVPKFQVFNNTDSFQPACDERIINIEIEQHYQYAISQLSPKRKEVYQLSRIEGMSYKEIASHTGLSVNTVENHISAALQFLRAYLTKVDIILSTLISLYIFFL